MLPALDIALEAAQRADQGADVDSVRLQEEETADNRPDAITKARPIVFARVARRLTHLATPLVRIRSRVVATPATPPGAWQLARRRQAMLPLGVLGQEALRLQAREWAGEVVALPIITAEPLDPAELFGRRDPLRRDPHPERVR